MPNPYFNIVGQDKISDTWDDLNTAFDEVSSDIQSLESRVGTNDAFGQVNNVPATSPDDTLTIEGGTGITISTNPASKKVIVTATGTATPGAHGSSHNSDGSDPIPDLVALKTAMPTKAPIASPTFTGTVTLPGDPISALQAATKQYVDSTPDRMARQAIINGNFDIWQRGATFTNPTSNQYIADRWQEANSPDGGTLPTVSISQQRLSPGEVPNSYWYASLGTNGAGTSLGTNSVYRLTQNIENGTRYLCGASKKVTVSFYARSNIAGKRIGVWLFQGYGTGGSPSAGENLNGTTFNLTSSFQKYTFTFTTNTLVGKTVGTNNDDALALNLYYMWGASRASVVGASTAETFGGSGIIDIAQVQVCAGDTALPYQPRSFAEELALCQRYYEKSYNLSDSPGTSTVNGAMVADANGDAFQLLSVRFQTRKRIAPTVTIYSTDGTANAIRNGTVGSNITSVAKDFIGETGLRIYPNNIVSTQFNDLQWHYTADAEL